MVAEAEATGRRPNWIGTWRRPWRVGFLTTASLICASGQGALALLLLARLGSDRGALAISAALILFGGLGCAAVLASRSLTLTLASRLNLLHRGLDAAREAQLIVGPDGQAAFSNAAFAASFRAMVERLRRGDALQASE